MTEKNYALLDESGLLTGYSYMRPGDEQAFVEVPIDCDLKPRRYRLEAGSFVPIVRDDSREGRVLALICQGLEDLDAGRPLSPALKNLIARYKETRGT